MDYRVIYCTPFFLAAILMLIVTMVAGSRLRTRGAWYLIFLCLSASVWAGSEGMLYLGLDISLMILITKFQYLGIAPLPPLALLFALSLFGHDSWISRKRLYLFFLIAAAIIFLVWTNSFHNLIFTDQYMVNTGKFPMLGLKHGLLWWVIILYHYLLIAALSLYLLRQMMTSAGFHRSQAGVILASVIVVWVVNAIYVTGNSPVPNMDIGPLAFTLVACAMAWGFFRYNLLDILPVAKSEIFRGLEEAIVVLDVKDRIMDINPSAETMLNVGLAEVVGRDIKQIADDHPQLKVLMGKVESDEVCLFAEGEERVYDLHMSSLKDNKGLKIGQIAVFRDITEKKRTVEALGESEQNFRTFFNTVEELLFILDYEGFISQVNTRVGKRLGYSEDELLGKSILVIHPKERHQEVGRIIEEILRGETRSCSVPLRTKDGHYIPVETYFVKGQWSGKKVLYGICKDISSLKESEEKFYKAFQSNAALMALSTVKEGHYIEVNNKFLQVLGYERDEVIGKTSKELEIFSNIEERLTAVEKLKETGHVKDLEITVRTKNGDERHGLFSVDIIQLQDRECMLTVMIDITELKHMEAQLQQAYKMEAIGTLAGGIAHDFNNILGIILGNTELAIDDLPEWNAARNNLEETKIACLRAKDVIQQLLSFSRKIEQDKKPIKMGPIIEESLKLLRSSIPATIEIQPNIPAELDAIIADSTQIHQVIINLCTNAAHAMQDEGGILQVSLSNVRVELDSVAGSSELKAGEYVKLSVADTGCGIAPEIENHIFDPYFTTKRVGEGAGMGLAVIHGIVENHGGAVSVTSTPGKGTKIDVYLPAIKEGNMDSELVLFESDAKGHEHILFVDDEEQIVQVARQTLERLGYEVSGYTSSIAALDAIRTTPDTFDLVISDTTMPDMTGDTLARKIGEIRSDLPIILCTGYSERISDEKIKPIGVRALLMKPIVKSELAKTIRQVLHHGNDGQRKSRILVIDDEPQIRALLRQMFEREGYAVLDASNGSEGIKQYSNESIDLIVTDLIMPEKEGIEMIFELKRDYPEVNIIAMSGGGRMAPEGYLEVAKKAGAICTFNKPIDREALLKAVAEILN